MVLGETTVWSSHQASHREIEAWRAELPFIVPPRGKVVDFEFSSAMFKNVADGAVDLRIASTAFLVSHLARIADAGQNQAMLDPAVWASFFASQAIDPIVVGANRKR